ncbi:MAG: PspA/IM30 family protein [Methylococcales symbiont of Hymedesmia sp. n. MRB-2018]|nr:MAG: PspA/IM30 family protein [Methylococcales symbiont of Hymedesmia sp. n. MRB-2018]KAF3982673.1 MAG: PspA/IM30 family protein [Methylococcales symbiont of Hymedesmia sp. n. MRB-2018]
MGFLNNVLKTMKGYGNEANDAFVDSQGIRIMEQEIRDAEKSQRQANESLTDVMAEQKRLARKVNDLTASITEYSDAISKLLDADNETLAMETAEKLAELESDLDGNQAVLDSYNEQVKELKAIIKDSSKQKDALKREVLIVKSTESAQKASVATAAQFSGTNSSLRSASASMERIKAKQQKRKDKMKAARELAAESNGDGELKDKLTTAGVIGNQNSAASILDRYRK